VVNFNARERDNASGPDPLLDGWCVHLEAKNLSDGTVESYRNDAGHLVTWLNGKPLEDVTRTDLEGFLADGLKRGLSAATVARRYRSLLQFYKWMVREGEVDVSPMDGMSPIVVPEHPPPVIDDDTLRLLLAACDGPRFEDRRDTALIRLLSTTGIRASELIGLHVVDVDIRRRSFTVLGKGQRRRSVELLPKAAEALDRYMRMRRKHPNASEPMLWLGVKGPLTTSGLRQLLERRCHKAGIPPINAHRFRHTFAHQAKLRGMNDDELMSVAGWQSPQMLQRYGRSAAHVRARAAHRRAFEGGEP
jgi:site-specific recombinase XerD